MNEPRHGVDGWVLVEYDWDPQTGIGRCSYVCRADSTHASRGQRADVLRPQSASPKHDGWRGRFCTGG